MMPAIYLAGPLFSAAERIFNASLAASLRKNGFRVFLPQELDHEQDQRRLFERLVAAIDETDLVMAVVDGADPDSGTAWEMGYARAKDKPVVALRTDFRRRAETAAAGVNLMLYYGATIYLEAQEVEDEGLTKAIKEALSSTR